MVKLISLMVRLTIIAGVLASLQSVVAKRLAAARNGGASAGSATGDDLASANSGLDLQGFDLTSMFLKMLPISTGQSRAKPAELPTPPQPSTLIRYNDAARGDSADLSVMELPPGAKAIVIDGKLQIFRPGTPLKPKQPANRQVARSDNRKQDEKPAGDESGLGKMDLNEILRQVEAINQAQK